MTGAGAHRVDVAILTALAVEEAAVVDAIGNCSVYPWRGLSLRLGDVAGRRVLVFPIGGMGNARAARAGEQVIDAWDPGLLLLAGIAGGIPVSPAELRSGDILVPDQVVGYEVAKVTAGGTMRRFEVYRPDARLLARARSLRPADWADAIAVPRPDDPGGRIRPVVHTGPVLTGDKILADGVMVADLRKAWPNAIGVEMESLGVALAAHQNGAGFLVVKAVSDFADDRKDDSWHRYAAAAAASFAVAVLVGFPQDDVPGRSGRRTSARAAAANHEADGSAMADAGPSPAEPAAGQRKENGKYVVDARGAEGVQVGDGNVQHNVFRGSCLDC